VTATTAPLILLAASVAFVVVAVQWWRIHAFFALMLAALLVGITAALIRPGAGGAVGAVETAVAAMGAACGKIAFPIALAAIIGVCLMESGAADKIVRRCVAVFGEKRTDVALLASGFVLAIPVFFDTVFFLLVPLARALARRTGRNYLLYLMAMCGGGVITHSTVPPTPGPLIVAEMLRLDLGVAILGGIACGLVPAGLALLLAHWLNARTPIPLRESLVAAAPATDWSARPESDLPAFLPAILPVALPVLLIGGASFLALARPAGAAAGWWAVAEFLGNKNVAMLLGTMVAVAVLMRTRGRRLGELADTLASPLETAGVIILITSAGGAYGAMIQNAGLGEAVRNLAEGRHLNLVLLAWLLAMVIRVAQGSATVAMITATGIIQSIAAGGPLGCHPFYLYLAIGYGSFFLSWMNDSGFWVVGRMGGLTERETLRTWSVLLSILSVAGLGQALLLSSFWPFPFR